MIAEVIVFPGFTSTSTSREIVLNDSIIDEDSILLEIELHPDDVIECISGNSEYPTEQEILIGASSGFKVLSVSESEFVVHPKDCELKLVNIACVKLSHFLH
jgi:hypothetical protein